MAYCAFSTARSYAAQHRNYRNCLQCRNARQRCTGSDGIACDRCMKLRKDCSLLDAINSGTAYRAINSGSGGLPAQRSPTADDEHRFGTILYVKPCDDERHVEILHVRKGINGVEQVYLSKCNLNYDSIAPVVYLGPWTEYVIKLQASTTTIEIDHLLDA